MGTLYVKIMLMDLLLFNIFFALCYVADPAQCHDVELEGRVLLDSEFMKTIQDDILLTDAIFRAADEDDDQTVKFGDEPEDDENEIHLPSKTLLNKLAKKENVVRKYKHHLTIKGQNTFEVVGQYLSKMFRLKENEMAILLNTSFKKYSSKLKSYFEYLRKQRVNDNVDRDAVVLDMVDISNTIFYSIEKSMLNSIVNNITVPIERKEVITNAIHKFSVVNKEVEMQFICIKFDVCRPYPAFSDHFAKLLSEILKLYNDKFEYIVFLTANIIERNLEFFKTIMSGPVYELFKEKLASAAKDNSTDTREKVSVLRTVLCERHKMIHTNDNALKRKTKAARIIIDIVDKIHADLGFDLLIEFDITTSAIKKWAANKDTDIKPIINSFFDSNFRKLKYHFSAKTIQEIVTLADVLWLGSSKDHRAAEYLLSQGSRFVRGFEVKETIRY